MNGIVNSNPKKGTVAIANCELVFECPRDWHKLTLTATQDVRYCEACAKNVTLCKTDQQLQQLAGAGACVAIEQPPVKTFQNQRIRMGLPPMSAKAKAFIEGLGDLNFPPDKKDLH
ncbi:hypothetical protein ACT80S_06475 [Ramlibacter sp. MAHUQ-53]|uniref:hypothetical protein n=1 Tax=unclassified Ramlibacter TaxID=2617605 RepID=UPI0036406FD0